MSIESLRADIVEIGRRMYARGYTASNDGNISVRVGDDRLLMTPKSVCKGFMTPDMMCITDLAGRKIQGDRDPSSEMLMHLEVYRQRPDVRAVVHAHPPTATGFAVAGIPLDRAVLAEVLTTLGSIPLAEYATPSTSELPEAVRKYIKAHDGMLLANHGALTVGGDLYSAYYKMETVEHFAQISLVARMLGRENLISREEVLRLQGLRGTYGIQAPAPICLDPDVPGASAPAQDVAAGRGENELADAATCQTVQAPAGTGSRLVPSLDFINDSHFRTSAALRQAAGEAGDEAEIRLTYRELSALIEDAIKNLR
jgi:L-fuculose-phosphate aldolase